MACRSTGKQRPPQVVTLPEHGNCAFVLYSFQTCPANTFRKTNKPTTAVVRLPAARPNIDAHAPDWRPKHRINFNQHTIAMPSLPRCTQPRSSQLDSGSGLLRARAGQTSNCKAPAFGAITRCFLWLKKTSCSLPGALHATAGPRNAIIVIPSSQLQRRQRQRQFAT